MGSGTATVDGGLVRHPMVPPLAVGMGARTLREILNAEVLWLASSRATTVIGLKLKASYASTGGTLADSIVGDLLRL